MRSNGNFSSGSTFVSFTERLKSFTKRSVKWPHPDSFVANPSSLAAAGFYFSPSEDNKDAVSCFICQKGLADWDPSDDPAAIHFDKCSTCPWAILRCTSDIPDSKGRYAFEASRLPSSSSMEKARLETFAPGGKSWWPQDGRNKGPSSKSMAKAGFIYTPASVSKKDDTCSCIYCGIELSGWQKDDDPMEEHRRRQDKTGPCPFFTVQEANSSSQFNKKVKGTRTSSKPKIKSKGRPKSKSKLPPPETASEDTLSASITGAPNFGLELELRLEEDPEDSQTQKELEEQVEPLEQTERRGQTELQKQAEQEEYIEQQERTELREQGELREQIEMQEQAELRERAEQSEQTELRKQAELRKPQELVVQEEVQMHEKSPEKKAGGKEHILTEAERSMTVEQWVRAEMERQYEILKTHGRSRIEAFKLQALEVAKRIEQL